tara:strand:- start:328 stop:1062 length:735 start_codon:yes stop_codon:yes gene_type:complete
MNFDKVQVHTWSPTNKPQQAKWNHLQANSSSIHQTIIEPDDVDIPIPNSHSRYNSNSNLRKQQKSNRKRAEIARAVKEHLIQTSQSVKLDGFVLLEGSNCEKKLPEDSRRADISGKGLGVVVEEDLAYFSRLIYVDAGNNHLPMEPFGNLPRLQELRLHCNAIRDLSRIPEAVINNGGFSSLLSLDLSYNAIGVSGVESLSTIESLQHLDLTYNTLEILPTPSVMSNFHNLKVSELHSSPLALS